jgi:hypothetical protein
MPANELQWGVPRERFKAIGATGRTRGDASQPLRCVLGRTGSPKNRLRGLASWASKRACAQASRSASASAGILSICFGIGFGGAPFRFGSCLDGERRVSFGSVYEPLLSNGPPARQFAKR